MAGLSNPSAWATAFSTSLNSLANLGTATSATITPPTSPERPFYFDLRINLASLNPGAAASLSFHILPAVDDGPTNFADVTSGTLAVVRPLNAGAGVKRDFVGELRCPSVPFRLALVNNSGVALAASGNTVEYMTKSEG